jgi:hypothetical protein
MHVLHAGFARRCEDIRSLTLLDQNALMEERGLLRGAGNAKTLKSVYDVCK